MRDGVIAATLPREAGREYTSLIDAHVRIEANAAPVFNGDGQMVGARLLSPRGSPQFISSNPACPTPSLCPYARSTAYPASAPWLLFRAESMYAAASLSPIPARWYVSTTRRMVSARIPPSPTPLELGEMADIVGFAESGGAVPALSDALYRGEAAGLKQILPAAVSPAQALYGNHDSELVRMDGVLIGRDLAASDTTLMLASDGFVFAVVLPLSISGPPSTAWHTGSRLQITGVCSVQIDAQRSGTERGVAIRQSFRILLRSPGDVDMLERPSWWTPAHTLLVLTVALGITLLVLAWVVVPHPSPQDPDPGYSPKRRAVPAPGTARRPHRSAHAPSPARPSRRRS